jgi:hypothetical protein
MDGFKVGVAARVEYTESSMVVESRPKCGICVLGPVSQDWRSSPNGLAVGKVEPNPILWLWLLWLLKEGN